MVNFQNDTTITRPRQDIILFNILERRQDLLDKYKNYKEQGIKNGNTDIRRLGVFQAALLTLAEEVRSMIIKAQKKETEQVYKTYEEIISDLESENEEQIIKAWHYIDDLLYSKGITKGDTKDVYDKENIWDSNRRVLGVRH